MDFSFKDTDPIFSIITPTYNRPELLKRAVQSVIDQSFPYYEHIIIDDGSVSDIFNLIREFSDPRIIFLKQDLNNGSSFSYNTGIKKSRGKYLLFLDDDDEYMPQFLERVYKSFSESVSYIDYLWTGVIKVKDTDSGEEELARLIWPSEFKNKEDGLAAATSIGNGYGVCVRREYVDQIGLYDESFIVGSDTDFMFRLATKGNFRTIPEILVKIHQHNAFQLTKYYGAERIATKEIIFERYHDLLKKYPKVHSVHLKGFANDCYIYGEKKKGKKAIISSIKLCPFTLTGYFNFLSLELNGKNIGNTSFGKAIKRLKFFLRSAFK